MKTPSAPSTSSGGSGIFVNYRRRDCDSSANFLADDLGEVFGAERVFLDHASIPPGADWPQHIRDQLAGSRVVVACFGAEWDRVLDDVTGENRLDEPGDWVRRELEWAFERKIPVVPVLLDGRTTLPLEALRLRPTIAFVAERQAIIVRSGEERAYGIRRLVDSIERLGVPRLEPLVRLWPLWLPVALLALPLLLWAVLSYGTRSNPVRTIHGIELVQIPAGRFLRGSAEPGTYRWPEHEVTIRDPFWLARTEVTNAQYRTFVEATGHHRPEAWNDPLLNGRDMPVVGVSWHDAVAFCRWAGLRLPSEAEWEYACRAGTTTVFAFGDRVTAAQVRCDHGAEDPGPPTGDLARPVGAGSLPANAWGLHEMHGNVWEWCQDEWHDDYQNAPTDGSAWEDGRYAMRVVRGGCWINDAPVCGAAWRNSNEPDERDPLIGFRPAAAAR